MSVDDVLDRAAFGPSGFALRQLPSQVGSGATWQDIIPVAGGRSGLIMGHLAHPEPDQARLIAGFRAALQSTADPVRALAALAGRAADAVFVVVDHDTGELRYSTAGAADLVTAGPAAAARRLDPAVGTLGRAVLPPAATMLALAGVPTQSDPGRALPAECTLMHPEQAADQVIAGLASRHPHSPVEIVLYRRPPGDLTLIVPARPASLAVVRGQLRQWLAVAGVAPEVAADALLAVGEAASNATEHAVIGVGHNVEMTIRASASQGRLRFEVSDNGRWKPAIEPEPAVRGHRGHGLPLIRALVDTADLIATDHGTTVEMRKELSP